jgi:hypothetical protein
MEKNRLCHEKSRKRESRQECGFSLSGDDDDDNIEDGEDDDEDLAALDAPQDLATPSDRVVVVVQRVLRMRVPPKSVHLCLRHRGQV